MHERWVSVHPVVLALTACAGELVRLKGGTFSGEVKKVNSLPYLIRMKLFDHVALDAPIQITEHEASGRFVPLTQIRNTSELQDAIVNLIPLLHASKDVADPIRYVFSEMVRNVLEHADSPVGAFVCAQYYASSNRISIGIADAGVGILRHIRHSYIVESSREAIQLALQPGVTGTTARRGGNESNAGAGLSSPKVSPVYRETCLYCIVVTRHLD